MPKGYLKTMFFAHEIYSFYWILFLFIDLHICPLVEQVINLRSIPFSFLSHFSLSFIHTDIESTWNQLKATSREGQLSGAGKKVMLAPLAPNIRGDKHCKGKGRSTPELTPSLFPTTTPEPQFWPAQGRGRHTSWTSMRPVLCVGWTFNTRKWLENYGFCPI